MLELSRAQEKLARESFLFRQIPEEGLDWAMAHCSVEQSERGTQLYTPSRFQRSLGLVLSGRVRVTRRELFVGVLKPGDWFGAAALFNDREEFPTTLTALSECRVLFFSQETVKELMTRWPAAAANYIRYLSGRIRFLSDRLDSVAAGTAEEKVEQFLLRSADENGTVTASAAGMAKALGLGRASVYRAFQSLERRGAITRNGKQIRIQQAKI